MEQIRIKSFDDLIAFIETHELPHEDLCKIVSGSMGVYVLFKTNDKGQLIEKLKDYWAKWKNTKERPLFLDIKID